MFYDRLLVPVIYLIINEMLYSELEIIRKVTDKPTKIRLISMFIEEYGGWLQHLNTVGLKWGAGGEEMGANREAVITRNHLNELHNELLKLIPC